jgi:8-oxo-dGTP pyrophosphatase MutT (NUDIX family)
MSSSEDLELVDELDKKLSLESSDKKEVSYKIFRESGEPNFTDVAISGNMRCITSIIFYNYYRGKTYILVQKRSKDMTHPGELCSPGGNCDEKETWLEALSREVLEEVGLDLGKINTTLFCVHHGQGRNNANMYNVVFGAKLGYKYPFIKPTHLDEMDDTFYDFRQGEIKNYHRWVEINRLLDEKEGPLLYFFKINLKKFIAIKGYKEKCIREVNKSEKFEKSNYK